MQKSYIYWPYLKELDTTITRVFKEEDAFFVELEKTLFYPHLAGGQPEDRGTIDGIRVLHVRENAGVIEHQVEEEMQEGPATLQLDWERRFDHMQQHTAQHILSGIFEQLFGIHSRVGRERTQRQAESAGIQPFHARQRFRRQRVATESRMQLQQASLLQR